MREKKNLGWLCNGRHLAGERKSAQTPCGRSRRLATTALPSTGRGEERMPGRGTLRPFAETGHRRRHLPGEGKSARTAVAPCGHLRRLSTAALPSYGLKWRSPRIANGRPCQSLRPKACFSLQNFRKNSGLQTPGTFKVIK